MKSVSEISFAKKSGLNILFIALIFISGNSLAQNLVTNPGFETAGWANANSGSADWLTGPSNVFGVENAYLGTRYMGISMGRSPAGGATDFREYVKSALTTPLVVGNTYEFSIMVSLSENYGDYACNRIGAAVTVTNPYYAFSNAPIPLIPVYAQPSVITNKVGWTMVGGTFTATSAAAWVIIGNFHTQTNTSWTYVGPGASFYYGYYYLDQGCVGPPGTCNIPLPNELLAFSGRRENKVPVLEWTTSSELKCQSFALERSADARNFEEVTVIEANKEAGDQNKYTYSDNSGLSGTQLWYYRLREVSGNGSKRFSQMVAVDLSDMASPQMNIYPVPSDGSITIEVTPVENLSTLKLFDSTGNLVYEKTVNGIEKIELKDLGAGTYFGLLKDANGQIARRKFIISGSR